MIFDHLGINVSDFAKSRSFFLEALRPLKLGIIAEGDGWATFGREGRGQFWFGTGDTVTTPIHIAFSAMTREEVRMFHRAALACGGHDNGAPGIRAQYHPNYFAAFVIGPDGHNIEAVSRTPTD
jgi:catechol 2,3-dioxygenase-like lactoylglutathione lyase family enzyme